MLARVQSYLMLGVDALPCEVEIDFDDTQQDKQTVVGLPDAAVKESIQRVRSAMSNTGYSPGTGNMLVNLAPADVKKEGPSYDLPIAVGLLIVCGVLDTASVRKRAAKSMIRPGVRASAASSGLATATGPEHEPLAEPLDLRDFLVVGELALDGRLRPVKGVIAMAALAKSKGLRGVIVPRDNVAEAAVVPGIDAIGCSTLAEVVGVIRGELPYEPHPPLDIDALLATANAEIDFGDVRGQEAVKRAIVVAAAGAHNILMLGPAGTGKSMMAKAFPGVLPPLSSAEAVEITRIYSAAGMLQPGVGLITTRPVRTPHHTASSAAIIGGGVVPRPGEVSLAHRGILFLDELAEFPRVVLETLRQPLEDHQVTIARSHSAPRFPADFMLVAAMNPTPKGDMPKGEAGRRDMDKYLAKLSGPLIDRIDIHVEAPAVPFKQLSGQTGPRGTDSAAMRAQVLAARQRQAARQGAATPNARLGARKLDTLAPMTEEARSILGQAITELGLSARAYDKIRRVARTIADIDGADTLQAQHVAEAVQYRLLDRKV